MNVIGIIPARMGSCRFPGKPLAKILGKPMVYHVYQRSRMAKILDDVFLATCDKEIEEYCLENGIKVIMTKDTHQRASDRAAEAMLIAEKIAKKKVDIAVMIQGDEPMVYPQMIDEAVKPLLSCRSIQVVNLMFPLKTSKECENHNIVKVVVDNDNFALYFSREPIPSQKKGAMKTRAYKQIAIIPFRRDFLIKFNKLKQTPLEKAESVDMLRLLEHGYRIKMVESPFNTYGVDVPEDLKRVEKLLRKDSLSGKY